MSTSIYAVESIDHRVHVPTAAMEHAEEIVDTVVTLEMSGVAAAHQIYPRDIRKCSNLEFGTKSSPRLQKHTLDGRALP
ncbi:MAG: hypothetical protein QF486_01545 [Candidatus Woesearchaeota archaeon]|nr:hypothetical protein [Candidatus Woesearchaeota archaeon]MDP7181102.1 hypothetical protein [Candidatus Woesearchaeota archaeon]MDP7198277.1 hypothetical protein [Candidatus Woesearchaeota archaeon]MDP7467379.1 hypothetical protein [Candidatus Woesearchaeota archaeon]MDP7647606.1 hypothetical protein [Candidatus Woesearchaeota archaeon]